ncbi:ABC transporter ATP-binding protein [Megasphaera hominis]|uniref:ABC transporter ATP-binding protein n=1 Tax=Megasphaera hominis TaxID=159836 RepID=A0ABR6VKA6_9FIRM|nr:ABC transporter ATP-binding protein [Megasphaera hominis]MBC3537715.1 ABC transporter ATP-binding protein [Megasphaera hominis]
MIGITKGQIDHPDRILSYFKRELPILGIVTVTGLLYNLGLGAGPYFEGLMAQCLYDILRHDAVPMDMVKIATAYVVVLGLVQAMRAGKRYSVRIFSAQISWIMRHTLYHSLVHMSRHELGRENLGNLMTKAVSDVDACSEGMRKFTTEIFDTGVALVVYFVMLLVYDWRLTFLACCMIPVAYVLANRLKHVVSRANIAYKGAEGRLNLMTMDRISHALTYRINGREAQRNASYETQLTAYEKASAKANIFEGSMMPIYNAIAMGGMLMIFYFGGRNVLGDGWMAWDIASFTTYVACFTKLAIKTSHAAKLFNAVQKAQVSWQRLKPLLGLHVAQAEAPAQAAPAPAAPVTLTLSDVTCRYDAASPSLAHLSFTAKPGEIIGITGVVASGKSMLGKLFIDEVPWRGTIRLGDRDFRDLTQAERRSYISYMGHEPELMTATIEENIALGDPIDVWPYLQSVCLDEEIAALPDQAQTVAGSSGTQLSGGQQARIALARTLAHVKPIVVLDDPLASVDPKGEGRILANLRAAGQDKVILYISHRLLHFPDFDRVLFLHDGTGTCGTHTELMSRCPAYAELYRKQAEGVDYDAR